MSSPPSQPPGWYYAQGDPPATHRWWDGVQWVGGPVSSDSANAGVGAPHLVPGGAANPYGYGPFGATYPFATPSSARPNYAGFWQRFGAMLLDNALLLVPLAVFAFIYFRSAPTHITSCTVNDRPGLCEVPTDGAIALFAVIAGVAALAWIILYHGRMEGRTGQTLGKRAVGIKTVGLHTGQPIGTGRAIGRFFAHWVSGFVCYLGYLWMLWDGQKQTWHDKMTDSIVVQADR